MKAWVKGAIIGALWGVASIIVAFSLGIKYMDIGTPHLIEMAIYYSFGFPTAFTIYLGDTLGFYGNIRVILPVVIGSFIGSGVMRILEFIKDKNGGYHEKD